MKRNLALSLALVFVGSTLVASPIPTAQISADAKWVVHLDVDRFLKGEIGKHLIDNFVEKQAAPIKEQLQKELGFEFDWGKIRSVTAYGTGYQPDRDTTGVILVRHQLALKNALDAAIAKGIPGFNVQMITDTPRPLYSFNQEAFASFESPDLLIVSPHRDAIEKARAVLDRSHPNLTGAEALSGYPTPPAGFFLMAVADGFSQHAPLPPTAAMLKQAMGARVVLGETSDRLRLNVSIKTATADSARQIQQISQGLLALATLNIDQNPDLRKLTQAASITAAGPVVTFGTEVPVADVIRRITP